MRKGEKMDKEDKLLNDRYFQIGQEIGFYDALIRIEVFVEYTKENSAVKCALKQLIKDYHKYYEIKESIYSKRVKSIEKKLGKEMF